MDKSDGGDVAEDPPAAAAACEHGLHTSMKVATPTSGDAITDEDADWGGTTSGFHDAATTSTDALVEEERGGRGVVLGNDEGLINDDGRAAGAEEVMERSDGDDTYHSTVEDENVSGTTPATSGLHDSSTHAVDEERDGGVGGNGGATDDDGSAAAVAEEGVAVGVPGEEHGNESWQRVASTSSLYLRRMPTEIVMTTDQSSTQDDESLIDELGADPTSQEASSTWFSDDNKNGLWLRKTCLRPQWTLRRQMMLAFGVVSTVAVFLVMATAIATTVISCNHVRDDSRANLRRWAKQRSGPTARYVAEALTPKIQPFDVVHIIRQATRDRFVGYPNATGYEDDANVPFFDVATGGNVFPLNSTRLLRLDWEMDDADVDVGGKDASISDGSASNSSGSVLSMAHAMYTMRGACDPTVTDPSARTYYPNCTDANNDVELGGIVAPTLTNGEIFRKSADLAPLLKAIYEYHDDVIGVGVFFANAGAGSSTMFPHYELDQRTTYVSIGCEWMSNPNPLDPSLGPIASRQEIERCHPEGTLVSSREYNPLERAWCRDQALNPHRVVSVGPYEDAWSDRLIITAGIAAYDRMTDEFIACTLVEFTLDDVERIIHEDVNIGEHSTISLVKWDDGDGGTSAVASQRWNRPGMATTEAASSFDENVLALGVKKIKSLVDFSEAWEPDEVRKRYEETFRQDDRTLVSGFPIPPPPESYDSAYRPDYLVILTVEEELLLESLNDVDQALDSGMRRLIGFTLLVGFVGLAVVILVIFAVSTLLTQPLQWMDKIATQIVDNFGQEFNDGTIDCTHENKRRWFIPRTEIWDVLREFRKMVSRFSGEGTTAARSVTVKPIEVKNQFVMYDKFRELYLSRRSKDNNFKFDYDESSISEEAPDHDSARQRQRRHYGPNVNSSDGATTAKSVAMLMNSVGNKHVCSSPLFWWIVATIVIPLLATTVSIAVVVTLQISRELPSFVDIVEQEFLELEKPMLSTASTLRAMQASSATGRVARDLHVFTRVAGWLLFDGIERSDSFTEMTTGANVCKAGYEAGTCQQYLRDTTLCDCAWNDDPQVPCRNYSDNSDSRYLQRMYFEGQSQDSWSNGDRNSTSFPDVAFSPNTTDWWGRVEEVPGAEKGSLASGHATTYDRLRVISALSAVQVPLYNYQAGRNRSNLLHVGFEADGMMVGYEGNCNSDHAKDFPFWVSSEANGGSTIARELCPLGKYGYDARCSDWYAASKFLSNAGMAPLRVAPRDRSTDVAAQSASMGLVDPATRQYVGTALIDFTPSFFFSLLRENTPLASGGFPVVIMAQGDHVEGDTVVGPGLSRNSSSRTPIRELVLPHDQDCAGVTCIYHRQGFEEILEAMRAGKAGVANFSRTKADGELSMEMLHVAYAPVRVRNLRAVNNSDFSRGVDEFTSHIYTVALVEPHWGILMPFRVVEETIQNELALAIGLLVIFISFAVAFVVYFSSRVTILITKAIVHLLEFIRCINRLDIADDIPPVDDIGSSCREMSHIFDTMGMLYTVVRFANSAFFAGNLERAYNVMVDALALFKRLGNKKAIAVASNNLGNTMLTMYRTMKASRTPIIFDMNMDRVVFLGISYFHEAITLGEEAYDKFYEEEGWSTNCLQFMQHLSNRYFNRAMFLLTVKDDHERPDEAERQGRRDLQIVQDLDVEVVDQCVEVGFTIDRAEHFDLAMVRIRGLLTLIEMGYTNDWPVEYSINEAFNDLKAALKEPSSDIFDEIGPAGRMQQVDAELLKYAKLCRKDVPDAARIGVRMLVEDQYTLANEQLMAVDALIDFVELTAKSDPTAAANYELIDELVNFRICLQRKLHDKIEFEVSKTVEEEVDESRPDALKKLALNQSFVSKQNLFIALLESTRGDVTMEIF